MKLQYNPHDFTFPCLIRFAPTTHARLMSGRTRIATRRSNSSSSTASITTSARSYDQAINVWTRALFLDRSHARARAYIERARSALAERQRESEELLQNGVGAFKRGDVVEARRLLHLAIARGAPADEALAVLERVNRLETTVAAEPPARMMSTRRLLEPPAETGTKSARTALLLASAAMVVFGVMGWAVARDWRIDWRRLALVDQAPIGVASAPAPIDPELPLPRRGEAALAQAQSLAAGGHLRDALIALELVRPTDPPEARRRSPANRDPACVACSRAGHGSGRRWTRRVERRAP